MVHSLKRIQTEAATQPRMNREDESRAGKECGADDPIDIRAAPVVSVHLSEELLSGPACFVFPRILEALPDRA